jgi:hypothetical protein
MGKSVSPVAASGSPTSNWIPTTPIFPRTPVLLPPEARTHCEPVNPCTCHSPWHCPAIRSPLTAAGRSKENFKWCCRPAPARSLSHHVRRDGKRDQIDQRPQPPPAEREDRKAVRTNSISSFMSTVTTISILRPPDRPSVRCRPVSLTCARFQARHRSRPNHFPQLLEPGDLLHRRRVSPRRGCLHRAIHRHGRRQRRANGAADHDLGLSDC